MKTAIFFSTIAVSVLCVGLNTLFGQQTFDLPAALEMAREKNPDLQAARQELEIARGRLVRAEYPNQFNPEIGGGAGRRSNLGGSGGSTDFSIVLSQELEVAGQRSKRIEE